MIHWTCDRSTTVEESDNDHPLIAFYSFDAAAATALPTTHNISLKTQYVTFLTGLSDTHTCSRPLFWVADFGCSGGV